MNTTADFAGQAMREKTWEEKTPDERIYTLAHELAYVIERNQALAAKIEKLENHRHDNASGMLLLPLQDHRQFGESDGRQRGIRYRLGLQKL